MSVMTKLLGIDEMIDAQTTLFIQHLSRIEQQNQQIVSFLEDIEDDLLESEKKVDTLVQLTKLSTQKLQTLTAQPESAPEKNDIEEQTDDSIDLENGEQVPIVDGMKVRFETGTELDGIDTEIAIK